MIDLSKEFYPCPKPAKKEKTIKTEIKKKSNNLAKLERNRESIIQDNENQCFLCGKIGKMTKDEAFGGRNRRKSIMHKLIFYLCLICHRKATDKKEVRVKLHQVAKAKFLEGHSEKEFLKEFGKNYI